MFADTLNVTSDGKAMIAAPNVFAALRGEQTHLCAVTNCSSCCHDLCCWVQSNTVFSLSGFHAGLETFSQLVYRNPDGSVSV